MYHNVPKFSDRQVWANSADPDQTAPCGCRGHFAWPGRKLPKTRFVLLWLIYIMHNNLVRRRKFVIFLKFMETDMESFVLHQVYSLCILRDFKNATFYIDCFPHWVDLMLFSIYTFLYSHIISNN